MMEYVYKYQSISEETKDALRKNYLYFPTPSQLDDPFDCLFAFDLGPDEIVNIPFRSKAHNIADGIKIVRESICVLSLSKINNHIILWSQYADGHKGICLKFRTYYHCEKPYFAFEESHFNDNATMGTYILPIHEVLYDQKLPHPMKIGEPNGFERFILTKHHDWSYQKEIRISTHFKVLRGNQKVRYRREYLEAIIFGMKTSEENISEIVNIVNECYVSQGLDVVLYKARQIEGKYAIEIEPYNA